MIDNKTANYNFPLPNAENTLLDDCGRISTAISQIDEQIQNLSEDIDEQIQSLSDTLSGDIENLSGDIENITSELNSKVSQQDFNVEISNLQVGANSLQSQFSLQINKVKEQIDERFLNLRGLTNSSVYVIGVPGTQGFGVGACPDIDDLDWISPITGHNDLWSDNYGNYMTTNGSIMVCIPKFFYRRGNKNNKFYGEYKLNSIDVVGADTFANEAEANAAGYALPRAFIDNGEEKPYFFIDKYKCSKDGNNSCTSLPNVNPISLTNSDGYTKSQGMTNCTGILADAITLSRARGEGRFQCQSVFMNAALQMLIDAHAQAATSATFCAWYDSSGVKNYPKGCNNGALADVDDTTVTYAQGDNGGASQKKPKTRATANFNKTTHNGQACGVADLNGMLYECLIGVTNTGSSDTDSAQITDATAYVLKRSAKLADLTAGYNSVTDAWGTAETLATRYDLVEDFFIGTNGTFSGKVGNGVNQVFSGEIDGSETEYLRANCGYVKTTASVSSNGSNQYGLDYYQEYNRANLVVLGSYTWSNSANAGAFYRSYSYRSFNSYYYGFRAAAYN